MEHYQQPILLGPLQLVQELVLVMLVAAEVEVVTQLPLLRQEAQVVEVQAVQQPLRLDQQMQLLIQAAVVVALHT
jgi:hypothetical protein